MRIGRPVPYVVVWKTRHGLAVYHGLMRPQDYRELSKRTDGNVFGEPVKPDTSGAVEFFGQLKRNHGITVPPDTPDAERRKYVFVWREMTESWSGRSETSTMWQVSLTDRELHDAAEALLGTRNVVDVVAVPHDEVPMGEEEFYDTIRREYRVEYKAKLGPKEWVPGGR